MIDLVAIIPFYLNILLEGLEDFEIIGKFQNFLQCVSINMGIRLLCLQFGWLSFDCIRLFLVEQKKYTIQTE